MAESRQHKLVLLGLLFGLLIMLITAASPLPMTLYSQIDNTNPGISRFGGTGTSAWPQMKVSAPFYINGPDNILYCTSSIWVPGIYMSGSPTWDINLSLYQGRINSNSTIIPDILLKSIIIPYALANDSPMYINLSYCGLNASLNYTLVSDILGTRDDNNFFGIIVNASEQGSHMPYHDVNYHNDEIGWADHHEGDSYGYSSVPVMIIYGSYATTTTLQQATTTTLGNAAYLPPIHLKAGKIMQVTPPANQPVQSSKGLLEDFIQWLTNLFK
jgi:hypothetical protein